jgi:hypothetical protein
MITRAIKNAFEVAKSRKWNKTFWAFDIHGTIIVPNWTKGNIPTDFYPGAKEALQIITKRADITTLLFTCSLPEEIPMYMEFFKKNDIHFNYVNENPEVKNQGYGHYDKKPYFNVLFEDKAGFNPIEDWNKVLKVLMDRYQPEESKV